MRDDRESYRYMIIAYGICAMVVSHTYVWWLYILLAGSQWVVKVYDDCASYLGDDGEFGAQVVKSDLTNHLVVNDDGSGCSFNDAEQSQRHGWLASASPTDYPDLWDETLLGKSWIIDLPTWLCTLPYLLDNHKATARFDGVAFNLLRLSTRQVNTLEMLFTFQ